MKKVFVLLFVAGFSVSLFASLQKTATAGTLENALDQISDPLEINLIENNLINFGSRTLADWLNSSSSPSSYLFNLALIELPGNIRLGISFDNTESWSDPFDVNQQTNVAISGVGDDTITTTITRRKNATDSSSRNMIFVLSPNIGFPIGLSYQYRQTGSIQRGSFSISSGSFGVISSGTITEILNTNTSQVHTRTSILYGDQGYDDSVSITHTFTPAFKLGELSIYVPFSISNFGNSYKADETNISETPTNTVKEVSHSYESYQENSKITSIQLAPSVVVPLDAFLPDLKVSAGIGFGMGFTPLSNTVYSLVSESGKNTPITNNITTLNTVTKENFLYLPISANAEIFWKKQVSEKIQIAFEFALSYAASLTSYRKTSLDSTSVSTNGVYAYRTSTRRVDTVFGFGSTFQTRFPVGFRWQVLDSLTLNFGSELTYFLSYSSVKTNSETPSYFDDNGGTTNTSLTSAGLSPYNTETFLEGGLAVTTTSFSSGFSWKLAEQLYLDGLLSAAVSDGTLLGGANRFLFGAFFDQLTDSARWNLELRLLF